MEKTQIMWTRIACASALAGMALIGCGGDDPRLNTDLPRERPLNSLSDAEARSFCEDIERFADDLADDIEPSKQQACNYIAVSFSETEQECEEIRAACLASDEDPTEDPDEEEEEPVEVRCADATADEIPESCDVTIGEFEVCLEDIADQSRDLFTSASCSMPGEPPDAEDELPASCAALEARCPGLFMDAEEPAGGEI